MRTPALTVLLLLGASAVYAQPAGITIIRGSSSKPAEPAPEAESAEKAAEPEAEAAPKKPEKVVRSSRSFRYDANGRRRAAPESASSSRIDKEGDSLRTYQNSNGKRVPYIREKEAVVVRGAGFLPPGAGYDTDEFGDAYTGDPAGVSPMTAATSTNSNSRGRIGPATSSATPSCAPVSR